MRRDKLIVVGLAAVVMTFAIIIIIKEFHLLPADMGILIVQDGAAPTEPVTNDQEAAEVTEPVVMDPETTEATEAVTIDPETAASTEPASGTSDRNYDLQSNASQEDAPQTSGEQASSGKSDSNRAEESATALTRQEDNQMFRYEELSQEIKDRITGVSYGVDCDVPYEELRYVNVLYWGFDGETHTGEMIVNKAIAQDTVDIFKELYDQKYPIERMVLVDEYDADDNASMAANNSSAFNYRLVDNGSDNLSLHSYGLAIDINPLYNPYIRKVDGETVVSPENGTEYADRSLDCDYYISKGDICYEAFISRGFTWGGDWKNSKDYQHFQKKLD